MLSAWPKLLRYAKLRSIMKEKVSMMIDANTRLCASLAYPNRKTTAPIMHNAGFDEVGVNLRYVAFEPKDIGEAMRAIRALGFVGVSVSKPYKEKVIQYIDELDETAKKIGAVNVVHNSEGKLRGYNSDWIGAIGALEEHTSLADKTVAVLGAGGASRAIVYGLTLRGANVHLFNRTAEKGERLSKEFGVTWGGTFEEVSNLMPKVIINATPVGRLDDTTSPITNKASEKSEVVMDINVRKGNSRMLLDAVSNGAVIIGGVRMLVLQGVFAFELFSGQKAPVDIMESAVIGAMK